MNITLTLFGQSLTFIVFVWTCHRWIWPPLIKAMRERQQTIADGLAASERAAKDLALAQDGAADQLRKAKEEARQIIEQARGRTVIMIEEAKNDARAEGERQKEAARAEIDQDVNRAKEKLRAQVAALAVSGAEKILQASIDRTRHAQLLEKLTAEL
ncbi:MAG: F0F1 ATP synthase subunit B [Proteobacteria bacterium]|nr:F0F1 ATP synthase subunit B [Pseudomonadota bacterium]